jgi:hypothetical protein
MSTPPPLTALSTAAPEVVESLVSVVPQLISDDVLLSPYSASRQQTLPSRQKFQAICLYCRIVGYDALVEQSRGDQDTFLEDLSKAFNELFVDIVRHSTGESADVLKCSTYSLFLTWCRVEDEDVEDLARSAVYCAQLIAQKSAAKVLGATSSLTLSIGIGVGELSVLHVGGEDGRRLLVMVGSAAQQATASESKCRNRSPDKCHIVCSKEAWNLVSDFFVAEDTFLDGSVVPSFESKAKNQRKTSVLGARKARVFNITAAQESSLRSYAPDSLAIDRMLQGADIQWANENRQVTFVAVRLGIKPQQLLAAALYDEAVQQINKVIAISQKVVYLFEGRVYKLLQDDDQLVMLACFGLPFSSHDDDCLRSVLAALSMSAALLEIGSVASIGIATERALCGTVGTRNRMDFIVHSPAIKASMQLMRRGISQSYGSVLIDKETVDECRSSLVFDLNEDDDAFRPGFVHLGIMQDDFIKLLQLQYKFMNDTRLSDFASVSVNAPSACELLSNRRAIGQESPFSSSKRKNSDMDPALMSANMSGGGNAPHLANYARRGSASIRRLSMTKLDIESHLSEAPEASSTLTASKRPVFTVVVPLGLKIENLDASDPALFLNIAIDTFQTFKDLFDAVLLKAIQSNVLPQDTKVDMIALAIAGTRFLIPNDESYDMVRLPHFVDAALPRGCGIPAELVVLSAEEVPRLQSYNSLSSRILLERAILLADNKVGAVVMLEGDQGIGKTTCISQLDRHVEKLGLISAFAAVSAFPTLTMDCFSSIIRQLLDKEAIKVGPHSTRSTVLRGILSEMVSKCDDTDYKVLDESLETEVAALLCTPMKYSRQNSGTLQHMTILEDDDGADLMDILDLTTEIEKNSRKLRLYFFILRFLSNSSSICILLDNCHLMDDESWALCLLLAFAMEGDSAAIDKIIGREIKPVNPFRPPKVLLVTAFRPLSKFRPVHWPNSDLYQVLLERSRCQFLKLEGLPREEVEELLFRKLGPDLPALPDRVINAVDDRCFGNPWMINQFIDSLMSMESHSSPTDKSPSPSKFSLSGLLSKSKTSFNLFDRISASDSVIPRPIISMYDAILDRLNLTQLAILKTAAMIGQFFKWSSLCKCFPFDSERAILLRELRGILDLNLIVEVPGQSEAAKSERILSFASPFILRTVLMRLVNEQKDSIKALVNREAAISQVASCRHHLQSAAPKNFVESINLKVGSLEVHRRESRSFFTLNIKRKLQGGFWKSRYCVLQHDKLLLFKDKSHFDNAVEAPAQAIFLMDASCQIENVQGKANCFRLDTIRHSRYGVESREPRSFVLSSETNDDAQNWVMMISLAIDSLVGDEVSMSTATAADMTAVETQSDASGESIESGKMSLPEMEADAYLCTFVNQARDLLSMGVYRMPNRFVAVTVDQSRRTTEAYLDISTDPRWKHLIITPITLLQWANSSVDLSVWNRELFLTDYFLAKTSVKLSDVQVFPDDELPGISSECFSQENWLTLTSYGLAHSHGRGAGCLDARLAMFLSRRIRDKLVGQNVSVENYRKQFELPASAKNVKSQYPWAKLTLDVQSPLSSAALNRSSVLSMSRRISTFRPTAVATEASKGDLKTTTSVSKKAIRLLSQAIKMIDEGSKETAADDISGGVNKMWVREQIRVALEAMGDDATPAELAAQKEANFSQILTKADELDLDNEHVEWLASQFSRVDVETAPPDVSATATSDSRTMDSKISDSSNSGPTRRLSLKSGSEVGRKSEVVVSTRHRASTFHIASTTIASQTQRDSKSPVMFFSPRHSAVRKSTSPIIEMEPKEVPVSSFSAPVKAVSPLVETPKEKRLSVSSVIESMFLPAVPQSLEPLLENPLLDPNVPLSDGYFYRGGEDAVMSGPLSAMDVMELYSKKLISLETLVFHGTLEDARSAQPPRGGFQALTEFIDTVEASVFSDYADWTSWDTNDGSPNQNAEMSRRSSMLLSRIWSPSEASRNFDSWNFNIWNLAPYELAPLTFVVISKLGLPDVFGLTSERWRLFISQVQSYMLHYNNPYHNFYHVCDVLQTVYLMMVKFGAHCYLKDTDIFALALGALCHDLDHPGLNNPYQINSRSRLAIIYNDQSVLENYHIALAFEMFSHPNTDVLEVLDAASRKAVRRLLISCVIATDMTYHFQLKGELDDMIKRLFSGPTVPVPDSIVDTSFFTSRPNLNFDSVVKDKDKDVLMKIVLHIADISNPSKPFDISKAWSDRVIEEFFNQGDLEKEQGLPVSANMDRATTFQDELSINFNDFIVAPYFMSLAGILPKLHTVCGQLLDNRDEWHRRFEERVKAMGMDEGPLEEVLSKWRKRQTAFNDQIGNVIAAAVEKLQ